MADSAGFINKAKYWDVIIYPENLDYETLEDASDVLGVPFAYCVHDKDKDGHNGDRKTHIHVCVSYPNTTTRKHVYEMFQALSKPGKKCAIPPQAAGDVRHSYDYLIHDTDNARKKGKHQYDPSERVLCNGYDIGLYEQISQAEKDEMAQELCDFAMTYGFEHMAALYKAFRNCSLHPEIEQCARFAENYGAYFQVFKSINAMLDRICRGHHQEALKKTREAKPPACSWCKSTKIVGAVTTPSGKLWYCEECAQTAYVCMSEYEEMKEGDLDV